MFANVVHTTIEMERLDEAVRGIEGVKQRLYGLPGFEGAYWLQPRDGQGLMVSFWVDAATAEAAAPSVGFSPAPGVTVAHVDTRAVIDHA